MGVFMDINVYYEDKICGKIDVYNQDYTVIFNVDCEIISLDITRVFLQNNQTVIPLGILMPKNNRYILTKKIPVSYINKYNLSEFRAFIKYDNDEVFNENTILKETIKDRYLAKVISQKIEKRSYENHDMYLFEFVKNDEFLFDFCFIMCEIDKQNGRTFISVKTNKKGEIIV